MPEIIRSEPELVRITIRCKGTVVDVEASEIDILMVRGPSIIFTCPACGLKHRIGGETFH